VRDRALLLPVGAGGEGAARAGEATAPDGRKLLDVLAEEGLPGLIEARDGKHREPWLR
jgi:hypothetical protein